jgi:hypothetical protein
VKLLRKLGLNRIPDWIFSSGRSSTLTGVSYDFLREEVANGNLHSVEPLPGFRRICFIDLVDWFETLCPPYPQAQLQGWEKLWLKTVLNYPEKERDRVYVRQLVAHAFKLGILVRKPCEICGREDADAHHDDYAKPLEVRFLCGTHHHRFHLGLPYDYQPKFPRKKRQQEVAQ